MNGVSLYKSKNPNISILSYILKQVTLRIKLKKIQPLYPILLISCLFKLKLS